jgi:hypothetical protein
VLIAATAKAALEICAPFSPAKTIFNALFWIKNKYRKLYKMCVLIIRSDRVLFAAGEQVSPQLDVLFGGHFTADLSLVPKNRRLFFIGWRR